MPSHVGGTILSSTEFRDALMLRYACVPSNLPTSCVGCGEYKNFDVNHALDCKKGGLVTARHDEIRDELRDLLAHVFSPSRIRCEPMIIPAPMRTNGTADRSDLLVLDFWENSTDTIIDVRVTNLDSKSYKNLPPKQALERQEKEKKRNIANPARTNVTISHPSWYRRTKCSVLKPEHFSRGLQSCLKKSGRSPIQLYGVSLMLE